MKASKTKKIVIGSICGFLALILVTITSYLLYVVFSYYRLEDNLALDISDGEGVSSALPVGDTLSLVTYNIGFGAYSADYSFFMDGGEYSRAFSEAAVRENTQGAIDTVRAQSPDLILLQEVDIAGTRSYQVDQGAILHDAFSDYECVFTQNYDSPYFLYPLSSPIGANRSGTMSFSAYEMISATRRSLPVEDSLYKFLDLDRAYTVSVIPCENGRNLVLYNLHLSAYTSDGSIADEQLRLLAADMQAQYKAGNYTIAAGDFNKDLLGDSSQYFARTEGDFTWAQPLNTSLLPSGFSVHTGTNFPTCRNADSAYRADGTDFVLSVDGVLVSPNVEVTLSKTVEVGFAYSDHNPVRVEFTLLPMIEETEELS